MEPPWEEAGHKTPGKEIQKEKQKRWVTPGERWRGWLRTENCGVPWSIAYASSICICLLYFKLVGIDPEKQIMKLYTIVALWCISTINSLWQLSSTVKVASV